MTCIHSHPYKLFLSYYRLFARLYGLVGRCVDYAFVNSSWTLGHIVQLWPLPDRTQIVYPPCGIETLAGLSLKRKGERQERVILSVGQFRPEKNHSLQLAVFARLLEQRKEAKARSQGKGKALVDLPLRLVLLGGSRNAEDEERVRRLKEESQRLGISDHVDIVVNAPFSDLLLWMQRADIGLHTMTNEHL